jgi:hypothetical protein
VSASFSRTDVPQLAIVRVCSAGGPYDDGDILSIAFSAPSVCRIVRHGELLAPGKVIGESLATADTVGDMPVPAAPVEGMPAPADVARARIEAEPLIPETISISVTVAAGPYAVGDELTLSFLDPRIGRIHSSPLAAARVDATPFEVGRIHSTLSGRASTAGSAETGELLHAAKASLVPAQSTNDDATADALRLDDVLNVTTMRRETERATPRTVESLEDCRPSPLVARTRLAWTSDRAHRFVQVCDRLFTVERLGWYRHALAMRLLLPDEIVCGDLATDREIADDLRILAESALETLGRPMLAAFMPNFSVTSEWLDSLDNAAAAQSLSRLRATLTRRAPARTIGNVTNGEVTRTQGSIALDELTSAPGTSAEALLPLLIANISPLAAVTEKLTAYRAALTELFGQTAGSAEPVRLSQMALPNHTLDDRLWHLVGVVNDAFVAPHESGA